MALKVERINETNEARHALFMSGATREQMEAFDRDAFERRHAFEKALEAMP